MQDYTIGESYTLPSLGKVYEREINPEIKIRSMTTEEEMKRVASVDYPYKNMSEIIDDCLVQSPGISSYDLCVGDYQFLLHKLRIVTYGEDYPVTTTCFYCGCENQDHINLEDLPVLKYNEEEFNKYREFDLPKSKKHIRLKVQTPRMLDRVSERVKDVKRKSNGTAPDMTLIYTIVELIDTVDGEKPDVVQLEQWVKKLPMADTNTIIQCAEKMNSMIGVDTHLTCECDVCGLIYESSMRTTAEFFRPALNF